MKPWGIYMGHRMTPNGTKEFWGFADAPIPEGSRLYTRPAVPLTKEQRERVFAKAQKRLDADQNLSWRIAIVEEVEAAHKIGGAE